MNECVEIIKKLFLQNIEHHNIIKDILKNLITRTSSSIVAVAIKNDNGKINLIAEYNNKEYRYFSKPLIFNNVSELSKQYSKYGNIKVKSLKNGPTIFIIIGGKKCPETAIEIISNVTRMIQIVISEMKRKENEEKLIELKSLLDRSRDIFYIVNKNGIIEYINERVKDYGYTQSEIIGKTPFEFANPQYLNYLSKAFKKAFLTGKTSQKLEYQLKRKDGTFFDVEQRSEMVFDKNGKPSKIVGTIRDITEEKIMLKKLYESESLLSKIFENARDIIYIKDTNENYIRVNKAFLKFFGFKKYDEALSKKDDELFDKETAQAIWREDEEVKKGKVLSVIRERQTKNKKVVIHSIRIPLKDENGKVKYIIGIVRDITQITKLQQKLAAIKITEDMSKRLSTLAHDINNILGVITGYASMVELGIKKHKKLLNEIKIINKSAKKISKMIQSFRRKASKISIN